MKKPIFCLLKITCFCLLVPALNFGQNNASNTLPNKDFQFVLSTGYGQRIAKIPENTTPDLKPYLKTLRSGLTIAAEGNYFFNDTWGVGVKYNRFSLNKSYTVSSQDLLLNENIFDDTIRIQHIGPQLITKLPFANKKQLFFSALGFGYTAFEQKSITNNNTTSQITGSKLNLSADLGYEFLFTDNIALVLKVGLISGSLTEITLEDEFGTSTIELRDDQKISLTRLDFLGGIRINI